MKRTAVVIAIIFLLLVACDSEPAEEILEENDSLTIQLIVTDTIGVELGDSCYVFGYAADAARTDSIIFVLDMSRAQLRRGVRRIHRGKRRWTERAVLSTVDGTAS